TSMTRIITSSTLSADFLTRSIGVLGSMSQFSHNVSIPFPDKERKYIFPFWGWRVIDFYVGKVIPSGWHTPFVCLVCRESPNKKRRPIGRGRLPKNCGSCRRGRRPPDLHSYKTALP